LPLDETIAKVHQAASLINDGKYYEASQIVKQVQDLSHPLIFHTIAKV
jgi:YfdX protein